MILYKSQTPYNDMTVVQDGDIVTLWSPSTVRQTVMDISRPEIPQLEYAKNTLCALAYCPRPACVLVLGLGGGSLPMMFHRACPQCHIEIVEIDPEIAEVAEKYFNFTPSERLRLIINDAFVFVRDAKKLYDFILFDAYLGQSLPREMATVEFLRRVESILTPRGFLVMNLMTGDRRHFESMLEKLDGVFEGLWLLDGESATNCVVFALRASTPSPGAGPARAGLPVDLGALGKRLRRHE